MNVKAKVFYPNFGRAFTTSEKMAYKKLIQNSKKALDIKDTTAVIFDFNMPSIEGENPAIGTTFSDCSKSFIPFLKDITAITSIQLQPQGKITRGNTSPYSGSAFAIGEHIIDLSKLATEKYGNLISYSTIENIDKMYPKDKDIREFRTDYSYVLGDKGTQGIQKDTLKKALKCFKDKIAVNDESALKLQREYNDFIHDNNEWLEKEAIFSALSEHYQSENINTWTESDKKLYSKDTPQNEREKRIKELKEQYNDTVEFEYFTQFIADKQQKESHKYFNSENISLYGDCLIGFSTSEMWGNIDCFKEGLYYGGPDPNCTETNGIQDWGLPALDYNKLGKCNNSDDISELGEVGKLLFNKYKLFFERYDGIRIDAAWQFITPFLYQETEGKVEQAKIPDINMTIFNIMDAAKKDAEDKKIMLELVGLSAGESRQKTLNKYPHIYTTAYSEYDENPKKFIEKGYYREGFYVGVANHDNDSLTNMAKDDYKRELHTRGFKDNYSFNTENAQFYSKNYSKQNKKDKQLENFRNTKFGEIYSAQNQFFTLPDLFGMSQRINISGKVNSANWTIRIPRDYEKFYFSQLAKGFGLNLPKALSIAMKMNKINNKELQKKCDEAAEILRSKGPLTEKEANKSMKKGQLEHIFEYA